MSHSKADQLADEDQRWIEAFERMGELAERGESDRTLIAELVEALEKAETWLEKWASAETELALIRAALIKAREALK